jgi:hypothetical protein
MQQELRAVDVAKDQMWEVVELPYVNEIFVIGLSDFTPALQLDQPCRF